MDHLPKLKKVNKYKSNTKNRNLFPKSTAEFHPIFSNKIPLAYVNGCACTAVLRHMLIFKTLFSVILCEMFH